MLGREEWHYAKQQHIRSLNERLLSITPNLPFEMWTAGDIETLKQALAEHGLVYIKLKKSLNNKFKVPEIRSKIDDLNLTAPAKLYVD